MNSMDNSPLNLSPKSGPARPESLQRITRTSEEISAWLCSQLAAMLGFDADAIDVREPFIGYGLGSLQGIGMVGDLEEWLGLRLSPTILYEYPCIAELAAHLARQQRSCVEDSGPDEAAVRFAGHGNGRKMSDDAVLDPAIYAALGPLHQVREPAAIFLTGATGYLGAFLLYELLRQTEARVYCLVRCSEPGAGRRRLQENLEAHSLWDEKFASRIIAVAGDLSRPLLGLQPGEFHLLAGEVDAIYHSGAAVNYLYPYSALRATNVLGTQEVLRLSTCARVKPVHYVSTLGVMYAADSTEPRVVCEHDPLEPCESLYLGFGYARSKWVAEQLVLTGRSHGLPVCIYRPALITGDSRAGRWNTDDLLCRLIKGCIQLGRAPELDITLDMVPVDYVSRAIAHLSGQPESVGKTFHLTNPRPLHWQELTTWMRSFGYAVEQSAYSDWQGELVDSTSHSKGNALEPLLPFFTEKVSEKQMSIPEMYSQAKIPRFDCRNTRQGLRDTSITCPSIDDRLLGTYFSYFIRSGFLDPPGAADALASSRAGNSVHPATPGRRNLRAVEGEVPRLKNEADVEDGVASRPPL